jgi:hypothetical protein
MNLPSFLTTLFENGWVRVPSAAPIGSSEIEAAKNVLVEYDREYRLSLAGVPPAFDVKIGCETAVAMYRICQCLVYRELMPQELLPELQLDEKRAASAVAHYSADVTMRFLPDVWRLARDASESDPLVACLSKLANRWPLSSVGIPVEQTISIEGFAGHPSLLALYVDRIIERRDKTRLGDRRVREAFQRAVGAYVELAPELSTTTSESK